MPPSICMIRVYIALLCYLLTTFGAPKILKEKLSYIISCTHLGDHIIEANGGSKEDQRVDYLNCCRHLDPSS